MATLKFLIMREGNLFPDDIALVTAQVKPEAIVDDFQLVAELKAGITKWMEQTKVGMDDWLRSQRDFNIGDLYPMGNFQPILDFCPNIRQLDIEFIDVAKNWMFDTVLAEPDEPETEE